MPKNFHFFQEGSIFNFCYIQMLTNSVRISGIRANFPPPSNDFFEKIRGGKLKPKFLIPKVPPKNQRLRRALQKPNWFFYFCMNGQQVFVEIDMYWSFSHKVSYFVICDALSKQNDWFVVSETMILYIHCDVKVTYASKYGLLQKTSRWRDFGSSKNKGGGSWKEGKLALIPLISAKAKEIISSANQLR